MMPTLFDDLPKYVEERNKEIRAAIDLMQESMMTPKLFANIDLDCKSWAALGQYIPFVPPSPKYGHYGLVTDYQPKEKMNKKPSIEYVVRHSSGSVEQWFTTEADAVRHAELLAAKNPGATYFACHCRPLTASKTQSVVTERL